MYKALLGPRAAIYGDHVELTRIRNADSNDEQDVGSDFASTLGTGGVLGTKFTWPDYGPNQERLSFSGQRSALERMDQPVQRENAFEGEFPELVRLRIRRTGSVRHRERRPHVLRVLCPHANRHSKQNCLVLTLERRSRAARACGKNLSRWLIMSTTRILEPSQDPPQN